MIPHTNVPGRFDMRASIRRSIARLYGISQDSPRGPTVPTLAPVLPSHGHAPRRGHHPSLSKETFMYRVVCGWLAVCLLALSPAPAFAQGTSTSSLSGV